MAPQALEDVRVLDLTHHIAGPYCTKLLADYGADVIKVERPDTGDGARRLGPFPDDVPNGERSGLFLHLNTNKRSVVLDLKTSKAVESVKELARGADVLVESFRPGVMARLGLDNEDLKEMYPRIIYCALSGFGDSGPLKDKPAFDGMIQAMGGGVSITGTKDTPPFLMGYPMGDTGGGLYAVQGILAALLEFAGNLNPPSSWAHPPATTVEVHPVTD